MPDTTKKRKVRLDASAPVECRECHAVFSVVAPHAFLDHKNRKGFFCPFCGKATDPKGEKWHAVPKLWTLTRKANEELKAGDPMSSAGVPDPMSSAGQAQSWRTTGDICGNCGGNGGHVPGCPKVSEL